MGGLMHAVDWFPTIAEAAGIQYKDPNQDGMSQWSAINSRGPAQRHEVIYNMDYHDDPVEGEAAIRVDDYKLIRGFPGRDQGWYKAASVGYAKFDFTDLYEPRELILNGTYMKNGKDSYK